MRKTAIRMLILGVAVLALFGAATTIKTGYAKSGVSEEVLQKMNGEVESWFNRAREWLEEAGVPHSDAEPDSEDRNAVALGESVSVPTRNSGLLAWVLVIVGLGAGGAILFVAFSKQYRMAEQSDSVSKVVDEIVAKNRRREQRMQSNKKSRTDEGEFDDITRAVDEIVAKYSNKE